MFTTLLGSIALTVALADGPPPPITVSLNNGGQYSRGEYAKVQFRAAADGFILLLQADQEGRVRVLFPLDPGDDNFIRGGKTYKVVGRNSHGTFYVDQTDGSGMVFAAWSRSPFRTADFVRGDHWDYTVFDQYDAKDNPEGQLTDLVLQMTDQGFDYAIDRYVVYNDADYASGGSTYVGLSGWPWPSYYSSGWRFGVAFGGPCCYDPWYWNTWYPAYGYGYGYGYGYPGYGYGYGYPGYGYGYPGYGYLGYPRAHNPRYTGYGRYGGSGAIFSGYRPYTFKPGGTIAGPGTAYRPRADVFAPRPSVFQAGRRGGPGQRVVGSGAGRSEAGAATIRGRAEPGRRPVARPAPQVESSRPRGGNVGRPSGGAAGGGTRRPSGSAPSGRATGSNGGGARRSIAGAGGTAPRAPSEASLPGGANRARRWDSDGAPVPPARSRPPSEPSSQGARRSAVGSGGGQERPSEGAGQARAGGGSPRVAPPSRSPENAPAQRSGGGSGGSPDRGGARSSGAGGFTGGGGGARSGGGGGGGGGGRASAGGGGRRGR